MAMRTRASVVILTDAPSAQGERAAKKRRPERAVFLVERDVAPVVRRRCAPSAARRPAAQMRDLHRRREEHAAAPPANGGAEVDVLFVHEIPLVEVPGR